MIDNGHKAGFSEPDTGLLAPDATVETEKQADAPEKDAAMTRFDLEQARKLVQASNKAVLAKGLPVTGVMMHRGTHIIVREYADGRMERLEGDEWKAWTPPG